ncbi:hypothetical protein MIMGU_mgv1a021128mg [Erythranthe guttata]|uniref:AAA+ ATPase domain-containing protein n=1 Tax=Erythranthe guttata TaxID=4155 RepID=A0A022PTV5_ERYGU|nr:hypothetical protein MIMGU_mgv1a021128mg [Erythranthe guttata]
MAESAVSFLLNHLSEWIGHEKQLIGSLGENAEFIRDEMGRMRAFVRMADEKQEVDPLLKEWLNQVRDIAYDAEDVLDKFVLRFPSRRRDGFSGRITQIYASVKNLKTRRRLASEMHAIRSRVSRVLEGQQRYRDIYGGASGREYVRDETALWYDGRGDALLLEEAEVVGIEKPKKQLIEWLSSTGRTRGGLKVISVVGTGGLGKTTLVRKVYEDDASVKTLFSCHVWMNVSSSFKLDVFLRTMIRRLVGEVKQPPPQGLETMDADEMKEFVYKFLQSRSYIIVLDDIWRLDAWEAIRYAFPRSGTRGSIIIITTRFQSISHTASIESNGHVYSMEPLSQEESKTLFCRKAFLGSSCPSYLEEIAGIILNKCEGLPLAIVVIGSLLATKNNNIEEWRKFHRSLGDELEGNHLRGMTRLLSLSYYDLPYYLKSCFLYLSIFPGDRSVYMLRLIRLWISEGFIQPKEGKTLEEVAEDYVKELFNRSLIQLEETPNYDRSIRVRVHDLLHTMIISKSREQGFVTIANSSQDTQWPANKIRRVAIHGSIEDMAGIKGCQHLRSVLVLDNVNTLTAITLSDFLRNLSKLLKVLELRGTLSSGKIPDEVFKFYHLKYLGLKYSKVKSIPRLIGKLENLETLDLRNTQVTELPVEILKLGRLRHLMVYNLYIRNRGYHPFDDVHSCRIPYRIGSLSSLQTLSDIDATRADVDTTVVKEIGKLTQLKELGVMKLRQEDGKDLCTSLAKLTRLETLHIASSQEDEVLDLLDPVSPTPPIRSLELRGRLLLLHGLTRLLLRWSRIENNDDDPLEHLQNLPNLMYLELSHAYQGDGICFKAAGFQRLKKLWLIRLEGLESVKVEEGSMPVLRELYIWGCKLVGEAPSGIEHLSDLQYVDFSDMSDGFVAKLEKQKEEEEAGNLQSFEMQISVRNLRSFEMRISIDNLRALRCNIRR